MLFNFKKEEAGAVKAFQRSSIKTGMRMYYSAPTLEALRSIYQAQVDGTEVYITEWQAALLLRHGCIRAAEEGYVATEIADAVLKLAEAGGLVSIKAKPAPDATWPTKKGAK